MNSHASEEQTGETHERMCKKVAELTQVVHMLFSRHHEKEHELETFRMAMAEKLGQVQSCWRQERSRAQDELKAAVAQTEKSLEDKYEKEITALRKRLSFSENQSRLMTDKLKSELREKQKIIDELRRDESKPDNIKLEDEEDLRPQIASLTTKLQQATESLNEAKRQKSIADEKLLHSESELKASSEENANLLDKLSEKDNELRRLKRRVQDLAAVRFRENGGASSTTTTPKDDAENAELDQLRKQLQFYRLELMNREENFNRKFSSHIGHISGPSVVLDSSSNIYAPKPRKTYKLSAVSMRPSITNNLPFITSGKEVAFNSEQLKNR